MRGVQATALLRDAVREAAARWVFWGFYGLSTALILFFLFLLRIDVIEGARATVTLFGETSPRALPVTRLVRQFQGGVASFLYVAGMGLALFASAGLMASTFEAGRIEWLLSKPVSRAGILLCRYAGNVLVVALNVCYLVFGVWLILGWKTGVWDAGFLAAAATTIFMFMVLLSVVTLAATLTGSSALATMVAFALMVLSPILAQHRLMVKLLDSEFWRDVWRALYYLLPKVYEVGRINMLLIRDRAVESWMPVWSSALFGVAVLAAAVIAFSRRDY
ncbi:MAG: ABC transporter permease [Bryobacteraceae bacterium]|nr:ABC transporter permease [Bryobacteraceae bacterium]